jgi:hypothetical protein
MRIEADSAGPGGVMPQPLMLGCASSIIGSASSTSRGTISIAASLSAKDNQRAGIAMNSIIYLVGLVVVILAILSFLGLR